MITQTSLARKLGISVSTIWVYESGLTPRVLTPQTARKFSEVIGKSMRWWIAASPQEIAAKIKAYRLAQRGE